ncbi:MAG: FAD-dependent oxidoreductase [Planctomycetaceae bacterium]
MTTPEDFSNRQIDPSVSRRGFLRGASALVAGAAGSLACARPSARAHGSGQENTSRFDVVVIGGTPGGIAAAIAAARMGRSVALVEYHKHFGGMSTSGLGKSDVTQREMIRGLFAEFIERVRKHYEEKYGLNSENYKLCRDGYYFEPSVAESIFLQMLAEQKTISLFPYHRLVGAITEKGRVVGVRVADRSNNQERELPGRVFIDATYEGDLYASAGAGFRFGRESRDEFKEPHAGHIYFDSRTKTFLPGGTGEGDQRLTAYTYRLCLSDDPDNAHRLNAPPPGYDRTRYLGYIGDARSGRFGENAITARVAFTIAPIPNHKTDVNMKPAGLGFTFAEENEGYIEADWAGRERICERIRNITLGLLWFVQNDEELPAEHREHAMQYHLARDEFADNGHFPFQLYVREARRLIGEYTLKELDVTGGPSGNGARFEDAIAVGEFPIDSFPVRKKQPGDSVVLEGYLGMLHNITRPYQIPYRIMIPEKIDGLIVPVAASTTHVAFSSIRLEPTWMVLGQAAGIAAHLAIARSVEPRRVPITELQSILREQKQVLEPPAKAV